MSTTRPKIRAASRFRVNVMARHHEDASRLFPVKGAERSAGVVWHERPGEPAFGDARAWIDCELRDEHDPGDHTIEVADVLGLEAASDGRSLVFFRGSYGGFEE
jgi:flavin reductase (DIM6/NTAB) family NADH-FMN oxidoreductase RutF